MTILIVEDDPDLLVSLTQDLRQLTRGVPVETAANGLAAIPLLPGDIHVVVSDIEMPQMNGLKLLARVRENYPWIAVILMTGNHIYKKADVRRLGATDLLCKPFSVADLWVRIAPLLPKP